MGKRDALKDLMSKNKTDKTDYTPVDDINLSNLSCINIIDDSNNEVNNTNDKSNDNVNNDNAVSNNEKSTVSNVEDNISKESDKTISTISDIEINDTSKSTLIDLYKYNLSNLNNISKERKVKYTLGVLPELKMWFNYTATRNGISSNKYAELLIKKALEDNIQMTMEDMVRIKSENTGAKPLCSFYFEEELIEEYKQLAARNGLNKTDLINYLIREEMKNQK